ncbi:MAG: dihydrolipoamide acetyltransferase family protein, partial [Sphingomonadaceae bacterium]
MGRYTFNLPDIGEGIAEAEIVEWHVKIGDRIEEDDRIADMMTDKATVEMESPVAGTVIATAGEAGDTIAIGSMLVVIETEGEDSATGIAAPPVSAMSPPAPEQIPTEPPAAAKPRTVEPEPVAITQPAPQATTPPPTVSEQPQEAHRSKVLATPAVRKRAAELGIDLADVRPAEDGRIRHSDLDAFIAYGAAQGYASASSARADETIRVIGLRRRIAENMQAAKRHIPHFTFVEECDVTELERIRAQLNDARGERPKLTMLPLLITGICRTLPDFPMINARFDDEAGEVTRYGKVQMGIATQTDAGLMVPVIRDAQA